MNCRDGKDLFQFGINNLHQWSQYLGKNLSCDCFDRFIDDNMINNKVVHWLDFHDKISMVSDDCFDCLFVCFVM